MFFVLNIMFLRNIHVNRNIYTDMVFFIEYSICLFSLDTWIVTRAFVCFVFWYVILNNDAVEMSDKCLLSFYLKMQYLGHKVSTAVTQARPCKAALAEWAAQLPYH